jgi:hypothetical protein
MTSFKYKYNKLIIKLMLPFIIKNLLCCESHTKMPSKSDSVHTSRRKSTVIKEQLKKQSILSHFLTLCLKMLEL